MKKIPIYKSSSHVARQQEHLLQTLFLNSFGSTHKTLYDHLMVMLQLSQNQPALNKEGVYIYTTLRVGSDPARKYQARMEVLNTLLTVVRN